MNADRFESGAPIWINRVAPRPGGRYQVVVRVGGDHADGEVVDGDIDTDALELCRGDLDGLGRPCLWVNPDAAQAAPAMWFVGIPEAGPRRAMSLVGFVNDVVPVGVVVSDAVFFHLPVRNDEQVGAIRWWVDDAVVDQVFVAEGWRRRRVATALVYAAGAHHQMHGWPGALRSDGRRTDLGENLVAGMRHPQRFAPRTEPMPPMDPRPERLSG